MATTAEQFENRIASLSGLPTLPSVVQKIIRMAEDRSSSAGDMADVLSTDQVLSSKILRLVNSPVYGFPGRISTIKHALVLLGSSVVKGLVLGSTVFGDIGRDKGQRLWEHSLACAIMSRRIAKEAGLADVEEVLVAGLLHDLGKVIMWHLAPSDYQAALDKSMEEGLHIGEAERHVFGIDHARVAGWIARQWCFPPRLSEPLSYHHRPELAKQCRDVTAAVHLGDILSRAVGLGFPGDMAMPKLNHEAFQSLRITYPRLDAIIEDAEMEFAAGALVFSLGD